MSHQAARARTKTPSASRHRIKDEIKSLRGVIRKFLTSPETITWVPSEHLTVETRAYLESLKIPIYPQNGKPSLLFHGLDGIKLGDLGEFNEILQHGEPLFLCNTSGSGKTRQILEILTKHWGFYFVTAPDSNGVGVGDMSKALDQIATYQEWVTDLETLPAEKRPEQDGLNSLIVQRVTNKLLAARMVVLELFIDVVREVDGEVQEKHKRLWLWFQLSESLNGQCQGAHPFVRIFEHVSCGNIDARISRLDDIRRKDIMWDFDKLKVQFIIALDETQPAMRQYPRCRISGKSPHMFRSILRSMSEILSQGLAVKLIMTGTSLSLHDFQNDFTGSVSKNLSGRMHSQLGTFDGPQLEIYLRRYVPGAILDTDSGQHLQQRMRDYLLGRYRFSVSFIEYFLANGLQSPHKLLTEYIRAQTDCEPGDTGSPFASFEPELTITIPRGKDFEWEVLRQDESTTREAVSVAQCYVLHGSQGED